MMNACMPDAQNAKRGEINYISNPPPIFSSDFLFPAPLEGEGGGGPALGGPGVGAGAPNG